MTPTPPTPPSTLVTGSPAQPQTQTQQQVPAQQAPTVDPVALQKQIDTLKAEATEKDRAAQFWYEKAKGGGAPAPAPAAAAAEPEVDMLELITTGGAKGFDAYMRSKGFVSRDEVEQAVNSKAQQLSTESELMTRYPDLKDHDSEFFKATAANYGDLKKNGVPEALAMKLAAEQAELHGIKSGKVKTPTQQTEEAKQQKEAERLARIKAQGGDRGTRPQEGSEADDELTEEEQTICRKMGITEEAYKKRAQKGVQMSVRMRG